jgi:hypothetical protein
MSFSPFLSIFPADFSALSFFNTAQNAEESLPRVREGLFVTIDK